MDEKPTLELSVRACRDCRFSVPGFNEDNVEDEDLARCTSPSAAMVGKPLYHLARAEAPLCSEMRNHVVCGPEAKLFKKLPEAPA